MNLLGLRERGKPLDRKIMTALDPSTLKSKRPGRRRVAPCVAGASLIRDDLSTMKTGELSTPKVKEQP